jgi:hypothetical protein
VVESAATVPVLEWRKDVGDERYLQDLTAVVAPQEAAVEAALLPNAS